MRESWKFHEHSKPLHDLFTMFILKIEELERNGIILFQACSYGQVNSRKKIAKKISSAIDWSRFFFHFGIIATTYLNQKLHILNQMAERNSNKLLDHGSSES